MTHQNFLLQGFEIYRFHCLLFCLHPKGSGLSLLSSCRNISLGVWYLLFLSLCMDLGVCFIDSAYENYSY